MLICIFAICQGKCNLLCYFLCLMEKPSQPVSLHTGPLRFTSTVLLAHTEVETSPSSVGCVCVSKGQGRRQKCKSQIVNDRKVQNAVQVGQRANPSPAGLALVFLCSHQQLRLDGDQTVNQCTLGNLFSRGRPPPEEGAEGADRLGRDVCARRRDSMVTTLVLVIASPQVAGSDGEMTCKDSGMRLLLSNPPLSRRPLGTRRTRVNRTSRLGLSSTALKRGRSEQITDQRFDFSKLSQHYSSWGLGGVQADEWRGGAAGWHK